MTFEHKSENKKILLGISITLLFVGIYFLNPDFSSPTQIGCTMDAKQCPDGSYVGRTGPRCEFTTCPAAPELPIGYTLQNYQVEKITGEACAGHSNCMVPGEYAAQSRCPFVSLCLENKCAVVCPSFRENR